MTDDYKDEFLLRLQKSVIYTTLKTKCADKDTDVIALVDKAVSYAFQRTKTIIKHMGEFTLHDGDHLFRVLNLMEKLMPEQIIRSLSAPELMLLVLSAFFHDIGMAPDEKQVLTWRKIWDNEPEVEPEEEKTFNEFKRFYSARPEQHEIIETQQKNILALQQNIYEQKEFNIKMLQQSLEHQKQINNLQNKLKIK